MNTKTQIVKASFMIATAMGVSSAAASIAVPDDFEIVAPCDNARVEVVWIDSAADFIGELSWVNPDGTGNDVVLWTNQSAVDGQSVFLPGTFDQGQRVDFSYQIIAGVADVFSTANEADWGQFTIDDSDPHDVIVGIEDVRLPDGDADFNDAQFHVIFSCGNTVPTPGSLALLGAGGVLVGRRRR